MGPIVTRCERPRSSYANGRSGVTRVCATSCARSAAGSAVMPRQRSGHSERRVGPIARNPTVKNGSGSSASTTESRISRSTRSGYARAYAIASSVPYEIPNSVSFSAPSSTRIASMSATESGVV